MREANRLLDDVALQVAPAHDEVRVDAGEDLRIGLGALAFPAVAFAEVTLFGTIDTGIRNQSKIVFGGGDESELGLVNGRTTNRWGLRGSEDLGGGLMANFWFEGAYTSDDRSETLDGFNRKSLVGLSKGGMSVDLGVDYTVNFKTQGIYDPMSYTYTAVAPTATRNVAGTRFQNLVTAGFRFGSGGIRVDYAPGEQVGVDTGNAMGVNADFVFGPVTVGAAWSTVDTSDTTATDTMNAGAAYKLGAFTIRAGWSNTESEAANTETPMWMLGLQYAISPTLNGRVGYYNTTFETAGAETGTEKLMMVALDYYLSKRTTAYVMFDRHALSGDQDGVHAVFGNAIRDGATGITVGMAHAF